MAVFFKNSYSFFRHFEKHLRLVGPLRRHFGELSGAAPGRVLIVETNRRDELVGKVSGAVGSLPPGAPDSLRLLNHMAGWLSPHPPHL